MNYSSRQITFFVPGLSMGHAGTYGVSRRAAITPKPCVLTRGQYGSPWVSGDRTVLKHNFNSTWELIMVHLDVFLNSLQWSALGGLYSFSLSPFSTDLCFSYGIYLILQHIVICYVLLGMYVSMLYWVWAWEGTIFLIVQSSQLLTYCFP